MFVRCAHPREKSRGTQGSLSSQPLLPTRERERGPQVGVQELVELVLAVLDAGRVVETGPHDQLVAAGGLYARLWRVQQLEEEIGRA